VRTLTILGSTGSIGTQAVEVVTRNPNVLKVDTLVAGGTRVGLLAQQAATLGVRTVAVANEEAVSALKEQVAIRCRESGAALPEVAEGNDVASALAARPVDVVLNAMDGAAGLLPTLSALHAGQRLALANKESLIIGGPLVLAAAATDQLTPVDSEHSALAQCLRAGRRDEVKRLVLTASGGPFRLRSRGDFGEVTASEALAHPTWDMGPLVTVNSATLVNKGLEVIEAHLLFGLPMEAIAVVIHPQSVVHSMVEFVDGSTIAQASPPDMRLPIALALSWPRRLSGVAPAIDWSSATAWEFAPLDDVLFPAVAIARRAGEASGTAPAVFNAANEVGVGRFLAGEIPFTSIVDCVAAVLDEHLASPSGSRDAAEETTSSFGAGTFGAGASGVGMPDAGQPSLTVDDVLAADGWARQRASQLLEVDSSPDG
jgi:1-deoxy-D-xylulose-5-phosphate reductoisomerase